MPDDSPYARQKRIEELIDLAQKYEWFTLFRDRNWKSRGRKPGGNKVARMAIRRAAMKRR